MDMTEAIKEAYAYADPAVTLYETFEISHSTWLNNILLVDADRALSTPQGDFRPATIKASLPETDSSVRGQMKLTINCLPKAHRDALFAAAQETDPVYVKYRQYTGPGVAPDAELPVSLSVASIEFQGDFETVVTCLYPDLVNIPFCRRIMTTGILPGGRV
ncbi:DUF1833 family protein [Desulfuromonas thiophila]|uniref:DUF1833 domain-containing protein n=1 Tax=Desulfuromonas thiophila TaxID=57664 RepID=A0A1G7B1L9_9BACT|nr:DUF1833 family protein [Desulfuromonas thiophila]SDE20747.1 protein of unknown function [Desulfuromonas thiophila]